MMEFITEYQIYLILGGLLIIMALIGYEAEQRDIIKKGGKIKKKKRKSKKGEELEAQEGMAEPGELEAVTYTDENTVTYTVPEEVESNNAELGYDTVTASDVVVPEGGIPVGYENVTYQEPTTESQVMATNETLQAFMEPTSNVVSQDTFGVNDMSAFQVSQVPNQDVQANSTEQWKL